MQRAEVVAKTSRFIKEKFAQDSTGHDWWHMHRVWQLAVRIAKQEKAGNLFVIELAALLHDIADFKFHGGDVEKGPKAARQWLQSLRVKEEIIAQVEDIIRHISFKGAGVKQELKTIEGQIVHDADKLDALGAIGIARVFSFSGAHGRAIFDPAETAVLHTTLEGYIANTNSAITHFYEKLLLLKDRMYTNTGKKMARRRHEFMEEFLKQFYKEWEGKL